MITLHNIDYNSGSLLIYFIGLFCFLSVIILILIGRNKKSEEKFSIYYDYPEKIYTSKNFYNNGNCAIDNGCIIPPDKNNLFPKNLLQIANNSFNQCNRYIDPNIKKCNTNPCRNINKECNNKNMYPIITPNIPKNTVIKGQCAICKIPQEGIVEYFGNCCKQGKNKECKQICRGCKTGYCENGWCFGNKCPVKSLCLFK